MFVLLIQEQKAARILKTDWRAHTRSPANDYSPKDADEEFYFDEKESLLKTVKIVEELLRAVEVRWRLT